MDANSFVYLFIKINDKIPLSMNPLFVSMKFDLTLFKYNTNKNINININK